MSFKGFWMVGSSPTMTNREVGDLYWKSEPTEDTPPQADVDDNLATPTSVILGLDPRIHEFQGLLDGRVKPDHDEPRGWRPLLEIRARGRHASAGRC